MFLDRAKINCNADPEKKILIINENVLVIIHVLQNKIKRQLHSNFVLNIYVYNHD